MEVGEVMADIFVMVSSSSRIFVQVCMKFLFHPTALNRNVINGMTSSLSSTASKQPSRVVAADTDETRETRENASDFPEEAGNGVDHGNSHRSNGTMDKGKEEIQHKVTKMDLKRPFGWEWLAQNKFSLFSMTAAGLAMSVATKGISRDLRIKL